MPMILPKAEGGPFPVKNGERMSAELELMLICSWGKNCKRLERVLSQRKPDVNYKNDDGETPLHSSCQCGSPEYVKRLLEEKADPNVPGTRHLYTPLEVVLSHINYTEEQDARLNGFDEVHRLDDTAVAIRPDIMPWRKCKELLEASGAIEGKCLTFDVKPNVRPDGSLAGGDEKPCELRAYNPKPDGSYTTADKLRSGKYDVMKYENGMLVQADYDLKTGHWDVGQGMTCEEEEEQGAKSEQN